MRARPKSPLKRFLKDESGTLTIEFVLWIPLLALWLMFSGVLFDGYMSRNQTAKVATTLTDIVARQTEVSDTFMAELDALKNELLTRSDGSGELRVSSLRFVDGAYEVLWSKAPGALEPMTADKVPVSVIPVMSANDTVVMIELIVPWTPFFNLAVMGPQVWNFALTSRPRFASEVAFAAP